jgi:ssDNA-binding replication factor A large subunit
MRGPVQGKQIEGTFWRDMAERMDALLQEGKVYFFSNGTVSPSNRRYSTVDNDYKINFSESKSEVREAEVQVSATRFQLSEAAWLEDQHACPEFKFLSVNCLPR